jgi:hypothetical protein
MPSRVTSRLGAGAAAALLIIAVLHAVWIFSPWPLSTWAAWSRAFGNETFRVPAPIMITVAALFAIAAYLIAVQSRVVRGPGPQWIYRAGSGGIAAVFILRAGIGWIQMWSMLDSPAMTEQFRRTTWLYLLVYLPIFFVLGAIAARVAFRSPGSRAFPRPTI